jgi:hypothetical protein
MTYLFIGGNSDGEERIIRRWSLSGGFWATDYYFAAVNLSDEEAMKRFLECTK